MFFLNLRECPTCKLKSQATPGKILVSYLFLVNQGSSFRNGSSVSAGLWPKFVKLVFFGYLNRIIRVVFSLLAGKW